MIKNYFYVIVKLFEFGLITGLVLYGGTYIIYLLNTASGLYNLLGGVALLGWIVTYVYYVIWFLKRVIKYYSKCSKAKKDVVSTEI
jgi:hypothetical protein